MSSTEYLGGHSSIADNSMAIDSAADTEPIDGGISVVGKTLPGSNEPIAPAESATGTDAFDTSNDVPTEKTMQVGSPIMKLPTEIRQMIAKFAATQIVDQRGKVPLTLSMVPEGITQVSKEFRDYTLREFYSSRDFSIQVPRNTDKLRRIHGLMDLQSLDRMSPNKSGRTTDMLKQAAEKVVSETEGCIEACAIFGLLHYHHVESIRVVFNGRCRFVCGDEFSPWQSGSFVLGFKAFDNNARPNEQLRHNWISRQFKFKRNRDWKDFESVRVLYASQLRDLLYFVDRPVFDATSFEDVLFHPAVQHIVKEMCLMGVMGAPALDWVEIILEDYENDEFRKSLGMD
ncbi:hypothetical protein VPNG_09656 [Cytospora leucostoma]|uniref:Uncharacterized protein n=1 Tax=Cytospora leucostoma TaxID=1230097 RepID=A0A423VMH4_9PEZI|nr:hypothetical protein VPNG_09656 [Cytospora leucostoma]